MSTLLIVVAVLVLAAAFLGSLGLVARAGDGKANAHREFLRDATPAHYQGREADFDERGRPY